ncbi:MAG: hypothetical protein ACREXR_02420, partial [Gammaproteobacteria bacterium]
TTGGGPSLPAVGGPSREDGRTFRAQGVPHRNDMLIESCDVGMHALRFAQRLPTAVSAFSTMGLLPTRYKHVRKM